MCLVTNWTSMQCVHMTSDSMQGWQLNPKTWETRAKLTGTAALERWDATGRAACLALNPHALS